MRMAALAASVLHALAIPPSVDLVLKYMYQSMCVLCIQRGILRESEVWGANPGHLFSTNNWGRPKNLDKAKTFWPPNADKWRNTKHNLASKCKNSITDEGSTATNSKATMDGRILEHLTVLKRGSNPKG